MATANPQNVNLSTGEENINQKSTAVVKCKTCGADMVFDIKKGALACPYCDNTEGISANVFDMEQDLSSFDETALRPEEGAITYLCPNCHAKTVMHQFGTSAKCPFCGATNILSVDELPGVSPNAILPFKITKEQASENSLKWIKRKWFAPNKLKKSFEAKNLNALYAPTFTFDAETSSTYEGKLGKEYTVTTGSGKNRRVETRVRWFSVNGTYNQVYDDVLVEASPTLEQSMLDKVGVFDTQNAVEYKKEFIAGFASERHDIGVNEAFVTAQDKMKKLIRNEILAKYEYDRVDYLNVNTKFGKKTFKHILVPLWCAGFKFKEKLYKYLVNGRSGLVGGKTPVSPLKVGACVLAGIAVLVLLYFLMK